MTPGPPIPELYKKFHIDKRYTSIGLFRELGKKFDIQKVFYPGSYVHITPSLVFPHVTYADSFGKTDQFFADSKTIEYIRAHKEYPASPVIRYYHQDYRDPFESLGREFDLVISQYAGFVGAGVKSYLKKHGVVACNNSHGDASMLSLDPDFRLAAVYRRKTDDAFTISDKNLGEYLVPKKGIQPTRAGLLESMRGIGYTKSPTGYVFEKVG